MSQNSVETARSSSDDEYSSDSSGEVSSESSEIDFELADLLADISSGNIDSKDPLSRDTRKALVRVSPAGARAVVSGISDAHKDLQVCHGLGRTSSLQTIRMAEHFTGLEPGTLNLHGVANLWLSESCTHIGNDSSYSIFCPPKADLEQMLYAVHHHGLPIGETVVPLGVRKNNVGYAIYTRAFPEDVRAYHYIPLIGKDAWDAGTPVHRLVDGEHRLFRAPFEDDERIPPILMHINIYIAVICAYQTLKKHRFRVKVPRHVREEVALIKKIGKHMFKVADTLYAPSKRLSPFKILKHRLRSGRSNDGASESASVNTDL